MKRKGMTNREMRDAGLKIANPARVQADLEQRRSNAARPHDPRPGRERTRRDATRAAIKEHE